MKIQRFVLIYLFLLLCVIPVQVFSQTDSKAVFNKEKFEKFQKQWIKYLQELGQVEGSISYEYDSSRTGKRSSYLELKSNYPLFLDMYGKGKGQISYIEGNNRNYSFKISRSRTESDEFLPWVLKEEVDLKTDVRSLNDMSFPTFPEDGSNPDDGYGYGNPECARIFTELGISLYVEYTKLNLPYLFSSRYTEILNYEETQIDGADCVKIEFNYQNPLLSERFRELQRETLNSETWVPCSLKGEVVLTTDYYLISEARLERRYLNAVDKMEAKVQYKLENGIPYPTQYYRKFESTDPDSEYKSLVATIKSAFDLRHYQGDMSEFTLSAYGLPEPETLSISTKKSFPRQTLFLCGFVFLAIGLKILVSKAHAKNKE